MRKSTNARVRRWVDALSSGFNFTVSHIPGTSNLADSFTRGSVAATAAAAASGPSGGALAPMKVVLGGTTIHNSRSFMEEIRALAGTGSDTAVDVGDGGGGAAGGAGGVGF